MFGDLHWRLNTHKRYRPLDERCNFIFIVVLSSWLCANCDELWRKVIISIKVVPSRWMKRRRCGWSRLEVGLKSILNRSAELVWSLDLVSFEIIGSAKVVLPECAFVFISCDSCLFNIWLLHLDRFWMSFTRSQQVVSLESILRANFARNFRSTVMKREYVNVYWQTNGWRARAMTNQSHWHSLPNEQIYPQSHLDMHDKPPHCATPRTTMCNSNNLIISKIITLRKP